MRITQGTFSFLPDLSDEQIRRQVEHALSRGWALSVELTGDPHPRNVYWEMWGQPMFDLRDAAGVLEAVRQCRRENPGSYVKVNAFDASSGWETVRLSFLVQRPAEEPGLSLSRAEGPGRRVGYAIRSRSGGPAAGRGA